MPLAISGNVLARHQWLLTSSCERRSADARATRRTGSGTGDVPAPGDRWAWTLPTVVAGPSLQHRFNAAAPSHNVSKAQQRMATGELSLQSQRAAFKQCRFRHGTGSVPSPVASFCCRHRSGRQSTGRAFAAGSNAARWMASLPRGRSPRPLRARG